jgi:predicted transcriptional regulator
MGKPTAVQLQGELQLEIIRALWKLDRASVQEVRRELPARHRGAYTTVQTVLNRLAERGLLVRERSGRSIFYSAKVSEADYYSQTLSQALDHASDQARRTAVAHLVGQLPAAERAEIETLAREVAERRARER